MKAFVVIIALAASASAFPSFGGGGDGGSKHAPCRVVYTSGEEETNDCPATANNFLSCQPVNLDGMKQAIRDQMPAMIDSAMQLIPQGMRPFVQIFLRQDTIMSRIMAKVDEFTADMTELSLCLPVS